MQQTPPGASVLDFVSGGFTAGKPDPALLVAMDAKNLYVSSLATASRMVARPLPVAFSMPVVLDYMPGSGARILGPLTHGATVSLSVSPSDSRTVAVTGWNPDHAGFPSNHGPEASAP